MAGVKGVTRDPVYYYVDTGCEYSGGRGCLDCPFEECRYVIGIERQKKQIIMDHVRGLLDKGIPPREIAVMVDRDIRSVQRYIKELEGEQD